MLSKLFGGSRSGPKNDAGEPLVFVAMPPLLSILVALEDRKGAPLTEGEVLKARDAAVCVAMPRAAAEQVAKERGYSDIALDRAWEEWRRFRAGKS
jgi:hypothetical protein